MIQPMSQLCEHWLIAGIRGNFFSKLVEGACVHSIVRREPRRLPACCIIAECNIASVAAWNKLRLTFQVWSLTYYGLIVPLN